MIFDKPIELLTKDDLTSLIENQVRESVLIEYKRDMYGNTDKAKKEFLKDVTALANASGGFLLIGVDEKNSLPVKLVGVNNADKEVSAILQLCNSCIQERIQGIKAFPIPIGNEKHIIIIEVPSSIRIPHMVSLGKHSSFWKRQGDQNVSMNIEDIRNAFIQGYEGMKRAKAILQRTYNDSKKIPNPGERILITIIPLYSRENLVDPTGQEFTELLRKFSPELPELLHDKIFFNGVSPFMNGLEGISYDNGTDIKKRCRIHNNGLFEMVICRDDLNPPMIHGPDLSDNFMNCLSVAKQFYRLSNISGPYIIKMTIDGIEKLKLFTRRSNFDRGMSRDPYPEESIIVPSTQFTNIDNIFLVANTYLNKLWRGFKYKSCPYFQDNGDYVSWIN